MELKEAVKESHTIEEVLRKLGWYSNGHVREKVKKMIEDEGLDTSHFDSLHWHKTVQRKWERIEKECPVCSTVFETLKDHPREKATCSYGCSNTYFRSGKDNPNWKSDSELNGNNRYQRICFRHHEKKCVVCGEDKIVAAHHYDGDNTNDDPENLIPLCPTHHCYVHSNHAEEVLPLIEEYRRKRVVG